MLLTPLRPNKPQKAVVREKGIPFPVGGWNSKQPLAAMDAKYAVQLKNWFPQPGWGEVRRGYRLHSWDIVSDATPILSLMSWAGPSSSKMFAAGGGAIYDVTSNAEATSSLTGLTDNKWQHVNFAISSGHYLYIVNGVDAARHYNGTTWATPSITGVSSTDLIGVNVHKRRLWFVQVNTADAWYLGTEAVAGAATKFALGPVFSRGGYLMAMGTWTRDGGSGSDDYAVFVSSEGQAALYQGTDPSDATKWGLVGVFDIPSPIGRRCFVKYGADLALITQQGVFPLSQLLSVDESQAGRVALSDNISPTFSSAARSYAGNFGWQAIVYPKGTRLIVNVPVAETSLAVQYVMNTLTGAWCEFDNHNANCWLVYEDDLYFGSNDGAIYKDDIGGLDYEDEIVAVGQTAYSAMGSANIKRWTMVRPLIVASGSVRPAIGVSTDFQETDTLSSQETTISATASFGSAVFGTAVFSADTNIVSDWVGVAAIGSFGSIKFRGRVGVAANDSITFWDYSLWNDDAIWQVVSADEETLRINGFFVLAEVGGQL